MILVSHDHYHFGELRTGASGCAQRGDYRSEKADFRFEKWL